MAGSLAEGEAAEETSEGGEDVGLDRLQVQLRLLMFFLVVLVPAVVVLLQDYDPLLDRTAFLGGGRGRVTDWPSGPVLQDNASVTFDRVITLSHGQKNTGPALISQLRSSHGLNVRIRGVRIAKKEGKNNCSV